MDDNRVIKFFREISRIPRASKDERRISEYLLGFAKERGLEVIGDEYYNVIIRKPAQGQSSQEEPLILQCHTDMVYVKEEGSDHDYEKGIIICEDEEFLFAQGTSLGADNGIGVAICLAVLDSKDMIHPELEVLFTVQEEVGLIGANNIDLSNIKGKRLINLDSEEEGIFYASCAGGVRCNAIWKLQVEPLENYIGIELKVFGLLGGHSGLYIDKGRGNAICLLARILYQLEKANGMIRINQFIVEGKANVIPSIGRVTIYVEPEQKANIIFSIEEIYREIKEELSGADTFDGSWTEVEGEGAVAYTRSLQEQLIRGLLLVPNGVTRVSFEIDGLVETSMSMGALFEQDDKIILETAIRSAGRTQKNALRNRLEIVLQDYADSYEFFNDYPGWLYSKKSNLRDVATTTYEEITGKKSIVAAIHGGLECGYFAEKIEGVDLISIGANLYDVHSISERISRQSIEFTYSYIIALLKKLA